MSKSVEYDRYHRDQEGNELVPAFVPHPFHQRVGLTSFGTRHEKDCSQARQRNLV